MSLITGIQGGAQNTCQQCSSLTEYETAQTPSQDSSLWDVI